MKKNELLKVQKRIQLLNLEKLKKGKVRDPTIRGLFIQQQAQLVQRLKPQYLKLL